MNSFIKLTPEELKEMCTNAIEMHERNVINNYNNNMPQISPSYTSEMFLLFYLPTFEINNPDCFDN